MLNLPDLPNRTAQLIWFVRDFLRDNVRISETSDRIVRSIVPWRGSNSDQNRDIHPLLSGSLYSNNACREHDWHTPTIKLEFVWDFACKGKGRRS